MAGSLGIADSTIVVDTTDNGAETVSWPDGGNTPFRGGVDAVPGTWTEQGKAHAIAA